MESTRKIKGGTMRKLMGLLTCSAFALASAMATLPPAAADDGVAGSVYYSIPLLGMAGDPHFGLRLDREIDEDVTFAQDALIFNDDPTRPAMVDFQFTDEGAVALNFGGVNALPALAGPLGFHGDPSEPWDSGEHVLIYTAGGVGLTLIICAIAGCF